MKNYSPVFLDQFGRFVDQSYCLLAAGTVLEVPTLAHHQGIVAYVNGMQVIIHLSKKLGKAAVSHPRELNNRTHAVILKRAPQTPEEGACIAHRAWTEAQRGTQWNWLNNCQDFVSRAVTGQNGSSSRNFLVGVALVCGVIIAAS